MCIVCAVYNQTSVKLPHASFGNISFVIVKLTNEVETVCLYK